MENKKICMIAHRGFSANYPDNTEIAFIKAAENGSGGADLMDGTPIFDLKPYIPYGDCHTDATGGFTDRAGEFLLQVEFPEELLNQLPGDKQEAAVGVLSHDPRPSYQRKPDRIYGLTFAGFDIRFKVNEDILTVVEVNKV